MKSTVKTFFLIVCMVANAAFINAGEFPSKKITIINPFSSGGSSYLQASTLAAALKPILNQKIQVVNKPGGGGGIGMLAAKQAKPDGHTMILTCLGPCGLTPNRANVGYNTPEDFSAVARVSTMPYAIAASPKSGITSFQELMAKAKKEPGTLTYGTCGAGLMQHMMFSNFLERENTDMKHVPFSGGAKSLSALLGNHINTSVQTASEFLPHYQAKTIKILAVTGDKRFPAYPDVPTLKELGYETIVQGTWFGFAVPKKTERAKIEILESAVREALKAPDVIAGFDKAKIYIDFLEGKKLDQIIAGEYANLKSLLNK